MLIDHILVVLFGVLLPLHSWRNFPGIVRALQTTPDLRPRLYRSNIVFLWLMALSVLAQWWFADRPFHALGATSALVTPVLWSLLVVGVAVVTGALSRRWLERLYQRNTVTELFPRTPRELRLFTLLAVTAGITEEIFYRGYLIWYLQQTMPLSVAALLSVVWFAVLHAYQGTSGVVLVALIGAALTVLYLWSGSLIAPMLLHAAIDGYAGLTGYRLYARRSA